MDAPTLWDARLSDPETSHEAAERVRPGRAALIEAIREVVLWHDGPITQFQIAECVQFRHPYRWDSSTIRTACSRAGLRAVDTKGTTPRGSRCIRFELGPKP